MCGGPSPSHPYRSTWQVVLIALLCSKPNWNYYRAQTVKEKRVHQHFIVIEDDIFDECKGWLQSTSKEKQHLNVDKHTKQKLNCKKPKESGS